MNINLKWGYWKKVYFAIGLWELVIIVVYQGVMGQPFNWAGIINVAIVAFFFGLSMPVIHIQSSREQEPQK
jgi:hypothetical protein